jgi:hypothetical protein
MLHQVIARRRESASIANVDGTPVTSVLVSLNVSNTQQSVITSKSNTDRSIADNKKPLSIQDVPFR